MPIYSWVDKKTGYEIEVLRSFDDYLVPPNEEELPEEEKGKEREWEKMVGSNIAVKKPWGWGSKGNWIIIFTVGVGTCVRFLDILL